MELGVFRMNKFGYYWFNRKHYISKHMEFAAFRVSKLIPKRLRYYIVLNAIAEATTGEYSSQSSHIDVFELLKRLRKKTYDKTN